MRSTYIADSTNTTGVNAIVARAIVARSFTGKTPAKRASPMPFLRIASLERIITDRYGKQRLPADEEGFDILRPMADHLAQIDPGRIRPWATKWMPGLPAADVDDLVASREALIAECGKTALHWGADELAHHVDLDDAARTRTRSWTVGAVDCDKAEREERRKITRAAAARAKRAAAGATPRAQSITATKPWIKDGFSTRRTWERHGKRPRVANSRPATSYPSLPVTNLRQHDESGCDRGSADEVRAFPPDENQSHKQKLYPAERSAAAERPKDATSPLPVGTGSKESGNVVFASPASPGKQQRDRVTAITITAGTPLPAGQYGHLDDDDDIPEGWLERLGLRLRGPISGRW